MFSQILRHLQWRVFTRKTPRAAFTCSGRRSPWRLGALSRPTLWPWRRTGPLPGTWNMGIYVRPANLTGVWRRTWAVRLVYIYEYTNRKPTTRHMNINVRPANLTGVWHRAWAVSLIYSIWVYLSAPLTRQAFLYVTLFRSLDLYHPVRVRLIRSCRAHRSSFSAALAREECAAYTGIFPVSAT